MGLSHFRSALSLSAALLMPIVGAQAGIVDYTATSLGSNVWRYDYTINNTAPSVDFDELTIYFSGSNYGTLSAESAPTGWDPIVVQPDAAIPSDGFYDALNLGGFIGSGVSVSGFSVTVTWHGTGAPGMQSYELIDSSTFSVVGVGSTTQVTAVTHGVPEPASVLLVLVGLGALRVESRAFSLINRRDKRAISSLS